MANDFISIGSTAPDEEDCVQVGENNYQERAVIEGLRFIDLIRKKIGPEPKGARLRLKWFPHDFGSYCEVVCTFDTENEETIDYAFRCENNAPATWDDETLVHPDVSLKKFNPESSWDGEN